MMALESCRASQTLVYNLPLYHSLHLQKIYPSLFEDIYALRGPLNSGASR